MKIYAMSDIHGYLSEFEEALTRVDLTGDNQLVLLGDYVRGPDSYGVLDRIISLQQKYGCERVVALLGNHEEMVLSGFAPIDGEERDDDEYIYWMSKLPLYYTAHNAVFVHAGIDEDAAADGLWEWGTDEHTYTSKFPAETGKIENFDMKIVAGHVGTYTIASDPFFHDIYYDGGSHYYIDGTVERSGEIPVLMYDTERDAFYRVTDSGEWEIAPYDEN